MVKLSDLKKEAAAPVVMENPKIKNDQPSQTAPTKTVKAKEQCPYCNRGYINVNKHLITCKQYPQNLVSTEPEISEENKYEMLLKPEIDFLIEAVGYWLSAWQGQYLKAKDKENLYIQPIIIKYENKLEFQKELIILSKNAK